MRKSLVLGVSLVIAMVFVCGFAASPKTTTAPSKPSSQVSAPVAGVPIDTFEDGDANKGPEWFVFDNAVLKVEKTTKLLGGDQSSAAQTGNYALSVKGNTTKWYVGGMGTMIGVDASKYNTIEMDVYGNGEGSGRIKVELYDDDNGNKDIEVDSAWVPKFDDLWNYEINVNWTGWKHLTIPFGALVLANPGKGSGKADFDQTAGSGGLVKIQLIFVANAEKGEINYSVDNIELTNK